MIKLNRGHFVYTESNYSKKYRELLAMSGYPYRIAFSKRTEVHHIDHDRSNNNYKNLVLLDKDIHRLYHRDCRTEKNRTVLYLDCIHPYKTYQDNFILNFVVNENYGEI